MSSIECTQCGYQSTDHDDEYWHDEGHREEAMKCGNCEKVHDSTEFPELVAIRCHKTAKRNRELDELRAADQSMLATTPWLPGAPEACRYR